MIARSVVVAEAGVVNANRRIYPADILRLAANQFELCSAGMFGQMEFSPDGTVSLAEASHSILDLKFDEETQTLRADIATLETPYGKVLHSLMSDGVDVKFRLGGIGTGKTNDDGHLLIETYQLVTVNAVAENGRR